MTRKHFSAARTLGCLVAGAALWVGLAGCESEAPGPQHAERAEPEEQPAPREGQPAGEPSPEEPQEPAGPGPELPGAPPEEPGPAMPGTGPPAGPGPGAAEPTPGEPSPLEPPPAEPPGAELPGTELPRPGLPAAELPPMERSPRLPDTPSETPSTLPADTPARLNVVSTAFQQGKPIPQKYTGDGEDLSPPLSWSGVPAGTEQLALICDDPDAPREEPWVHWVIYSIPPETAGLPEGVPRTERPESPPRALQGRNSWPTDNIGYRGPAPPPKDDAHRYFFKLYALDTALSLEPGLTKNELLDAIEGHVLARGQLLGTYDR